MIEGIASHFNTVSWYPISNDCMQADEYQLRCMQILFVYCRGQSQNWSALSGVNPLIITPFAVTTVECMCNEHFG